MPTRILYLDLEPDEASRRMRESISASAGPGLQFESFSSDDALVEGLLGPLAEVTLLVIRVRDCDHLAQLALHSTLIRGTRLVVVLPEMEHALISLAHVLHPSLVLSVEDDFCEVAAMVAKLGQSALTSEARPAAHVQLSK
ncbi:MAG: hypothetical protein WC655_18315 [Candidatus Hydrogenedentales bacterium]|jgi:hypothetical protein